MVDAAWVAAAGIVAQFGVLSRGPGGCRFRSYNCGDGDEFS